MALFLPIQVDVEFTSLCLALHSMALAPISHPCLVRWGLFSTLKISAAFEKETNYDNWYNPRNSDYRRTDNSGTTCAWVL